jgi:uncharacterized membrane protein
MAVTLVYTGEHYVIDILIGWIYAIVIYAAYSYAERAWERRKAMRRAAPAAPPRAGAGGAVHAPEPQPATLSSE